MNFVAHQFLSFQQSEIQIGNLLGEVVRGKDYENYEGAIQKGILLHRQIDTFTDSHPVVKKSTYRFHERYSKYAPVIVDVLYDYILISKWENYSNLPYETFVQECYALFEQHFDEFPSSLQYIVEHLLKYDWFRNYSSLEGIGKTLKGISQRSKFPNNIETAVEEFKIHEDLFKEEFDAFFPELISHSKSFIKS